MKCKFCGLELNPRLPWPDETCDGCWEVARRLGGFLAQSEAARAYVAEALEPWAYVVDIFGAREESRKIPVYTGDKRTAQMSKKWHWNNAIHAALEVIRKELSGIDKRVDRVKRLRASCAQAAIDLIVLEEIELTMARIADEIESLWLAAQPAGDAQRADSLSRPGCRSYENNHG